MKISEIVKIGSKTLCIVAATGLLAGSLMADDVSLHSLEQGWYSTSKNSCSGVHKLNKSDLKDKARTHCENSHDSKGLNKLRNENYTKTSCDKEKSGTQVTKVTARGVLTYNCKN